MNIQGTYGCMLPYSRKVWWEECLVNLVLKRFGKGKFGEWRCELIVIIM